MESSVSEIIKTAIELDESVIKNYLIEQKNESRDSPQIFYWKLKAKILEIKQENPNAMKWLLHEDLGGWFEDMGLINRNIYKEGIALQSGQGRFLEHLEKLINKFEMISNVVNSLIEQNSLFSNTSKEKNILKKPSHAAIIINSDIVNKLFDGLKQYFEGKEEELMKVLTGKAISEKLIWPLNQNQLADLFLRLSYNEFIKNNKTEIKIWLVQNFTLANGEINSSTIYETLTRKNEINKQNRILENLAPFKPKLK
jgi:hypothetical protein